MSREGIIDYESTDKDTAPFYCPACGRRWAYMTHCTGRAESPHQPTLTVAIDEIRPVDGGEWEHEQSTDTGKIRQTLTSDPAGHTAAPNTDNLG